MKKACQMESDKTAVDIVENNNRYAKNENKYKFVNTNLRKRGRKPSMIEEEEVCFVCLDGGELVLCEHRSCPKAYHPSCVGQDAALLKEKISWTCGWHLCSSCEKPAKFMCYTCTYSVCKACIKEAGFVLVKRSKGFCEHCLQLALMIEENKDVDSEGVKVDFTDNETYEFLFREYWLEIRDRESLTLAQLQNTWRAFKNIEDHVSNDVDSDETFEEGDVSITSSEETSDWAVEEHYNEGRKRRTRSKTMIIMEEDEVEMKCMTGRKDIPVAREFNGWVSKELTEFIELVKGDVQNASSQCEVWPLLLKYITQNKLEDPRKKSQIICDEKLYKLFGKHIVGLSEIYKLLESHFTSKQGISKHERQDAPLNNDDNQAELDGNKERVGRSVVDKKNKSPKNSDEDKIIKPNLNDYAAINVHNINLVYLRRALLEDLLKDPGSFNDKVVGSFVRIRVTGIANRSEVCYRLVQVVGTKKVQQSDKTGSKMTDIILEILNLNKQEGISIDTVSNQNFTAEECQRLHQSVKCRLIKQPTVGEFEEKAKALHEVKLNDWLETEKIKLSHLRDRANEKGHRKELRECVEKLQLLSSPGERARKLQEVPDVIADPNLDLDYDIDDKEEKPEDKSQGNWETPQESSGKIWDENKTNNSDWRHNRWDRVHTVAVGHAGETSRGQLCNSNKSIDCEKIRSAFWGKRRDGEGHTLNEWETQKCSEGMFSGCNTISSPGEKNLGGIKDWSQSSGESTVFASSSDLTQEKGQMHKSSTSIKQDINRTDPCSREGDSEAEKVWHYQDPTGKIQGPFSMLQLRRWNRTGLFPLDLSIWRTLERQEHSILLTDALLGRFETFSMLQGKNEVEQNAVGKTRYQSH